MTEQPKVNMLLIAILVLALGAVGYVVLNAPDKREPGEKISGAIDALPKGLDKAAEQLKDRTPGQKLEDIAKDAGTDAKKAINQH
jgi:hypothetical protein